MVQLCANKSILFRTMTSVRMVCYVRAESAPQRILSYREVHHRYFPARKRRRRRRDADDGIAPDDFPHGKVCYIPMLYMRDDDTSVTINGSGFLCQNKIGKMCS